MSAIKNLARKVTTALFSRALGDVFEWGPSVPEGERPRYVLNAGPVPPESLSRAPGWGGHEGPRPAIG